MKRYVIASALLTAVSALAHAKTPLYDANITEAAVLGAQEGWCDALVSISKTHAEKGQAAAKKLAGEVIDAAYGYNLGPVLFKPTLTVSPQTFRTTRDGALAYFVGGDANYPDTGFALKGWTSCSVKNAAVHINGDVATTMGNVMITDKTGKVTTVDKTWSFKRTDDGKLRIVLHHSSLPYSAK